MAPPRLKLRPCAPAPRPPPRAARGHGATARGGRRSYSGRDDETRYSARSGPWALAHGNSESSRIPPSAGPSLEQGPWGPTFYSSSPSARPSCSFVHRPPRSRHTTRPLAPPTSRCACPSPSAAVEAGVLGWGEVAGFSVRAGMKYATPHSPTETRMRSATLRRSRSSPAPGHRLPLLILSRDVSAKQARHCELDGLALRVSGTHGRVVPRGGALALHTIRAR